MLYRVKNFFDWFAITGEKREKAEALAQLTADMADGMTHLKDYLALAAVIVHARPKRIFEIGTYKGLTSNFFLELNPDCEVTSIAFVRSFINSFWRKYNNTDLGRKDVGAFVTDYNKNRFVQLYGDSHKLNAMDLKNRFGKFDMIFIDGDHTREGVKEDTLLAKKIIGDNGIICWHDVNPKEKYLGVKMYLEEELPYTALATYDDYIGGIACWSKSIEDSIIKGRL